MTASHKYKALGLAGLLVAMAMLVVGALGATGASAANPDLKFCVKIDEPITEGFWEDAKCTTKLSGGKFARVSPPAVPVTGMAGHWCAHVESAGVEPSAWKNNVCTASEGKGGFVRFQPKNAGKNPNVFSATSVSTPKPKLETVKKRVVECESDTATGEFTGEKSVGKVSVTFTGKCHTTAFGGGECHSIEPTVEAEGTIKTFPLKGGLFDINGTHATTKEVGQALGPETAGNPLAKFLCKTFLGNETLTVTGSVVGKVTPTNTMAKTSTLTLKMKTGVQEPTEYEEENPVGSGTWVKVSDFLKTEGSGPENFAAEQSGQETTQTVTTEEETEVKA